MESAGFATADEVPRFTQILTAEGHLVGARPSQLSDAELVDLYRLMLTSRVLSERSFALQRQGRLGTIAGAVGQEAAIVGSAWALDPHRDWIVPQYRELAALMHHGVPLTQLLHYFRGHPSGRPYPESVKVMPIQIALAAQLPHAVGLAWGMRLQGQDGVVLTYFGEGAASEGDFHEAVNLAGVRRAPVVFLLQNNGWAISTPARLQTLAPCLADRAIGYGIAGEQVDGNDVLAVFDATARAVALARDGGGPTLIEAVTDRAGPHNTADDPTRYVAAAEMQEAAARDPLARFRAFLEGQGLLSDDQVADCRAELDSAIAAAIAEVEAAGEAGAGALFDEVYANPPARVVRQRAGAERIGIRHA